MNVKQSQAVVASQASETAALDMPWPSEIAPILTRIEGELQSGRVKDALEFVRRADISSPWMANALGVCQLRQGQAHAAVSTFRRLAVADHLVLRADAPLVFKANFATALLLSGNLVGCRSTLEEIGKSEHASVERLRAALAQWKKSLSLWQRINWYLGGEPGRPVELDMPGDLR